MKRGEKLREAQGFRVKHQRPLQNTVAQSRIELSRKEGIRGY